MNKKGLAGIDANWITDVLIGVGVSIGVIALSAISPFLGAIGIPSLPQSIVSDLGRILIVCLAAPIFEEIFFRDFLIDFFQNKILKKAIPFVIAALLSSILFSLFHLAAYGSSLQAMQGSFISAALVGMVFAYLRKFTNSNIGNITAHAIINFIILQRVYSIVSIG